MKKIQLRTADGRIAKGNGLVHGMSKDPVYDCWIAMKARCFNPQHPEYKHYGGRGIRVCGEWADSFENFYDDMGNKPFVGATLDRIDNEGDYRPDNCRWITIQEQQKNKRGSKEVVGVTYEPDRKRWRADIRRFGKRRFLGRFLVYSDAVNARLTAEGLYGV